MLLQLRKEVGGTSATASVAVNNNKEEDEPTSSYDRIARLRGIYNKRKFDIQRFNMIEQTKNTSVEETETQN